MKISIVFLGSTGAGPVYSLEMAKAISQSNDIQLQIIISEQICNKERWKELFLYKNNVTLNIVPTYNHTILGAMVGLINIIRIRRIVKLIRDFRPEAIYYPFDVVWGWYLYRALNGLAIQIYTMHDPHPHDPRKGMLKPLYNKIVFNSLNNIDAFILLNKIDVKYIEGLYKKPVIVIPHASFSEYDGQLDNECQLSNTIGFFGRIEPYKGLDLLVNSFIQIERKDLKLLIAGSGSIPPSVRQQIENDDRIELINRYIKDEELPALIKRTDFVVLPYRTASQSGVIPLAYAFGKTVIATNVGALSEQVLPQTGILINPDVNEITRSIITLYDDPALIKRLGKNAYKFAKTELTWESSAKTLLQYLQNVISHV